MSSTKSIAAELVIVALLLGGCGPSKPAVDDAPFRQAVERYLESKNMAMAIKEVKEPPSITDANAELRASLVHRELKGPSVTWTFFFQRSPTGEWSVTRHED